MINFPSINFFEKLRRFYVSFSIVNLEEQTKKASKHHYFLIWCLFSRLCATVLLLLFSNWHKWQLNLSYQFFFGMSIAVSKIEPDVMDFDLLVSVFGKLWSNRLVEICNQCRKTYLSLKLHRCRLRSLRVTMTGSLNGHCVKISVCIWLIP